jgi:short-subunit dehydrogenase
MITGASSGIGESLAKCFAEHHFDLVLVARSTDKLKSPSLIIAGRAAPKWLMSNVGGAMERALG